MSVILQTRGEVGMAPHLECPLCGHFFKSHAHQLTHMAASHPARLDDVVVGRLGNILMYQSTARLFHCSDCFYTSRDFTKLYKHIITKHCVDERDGGGGDEEKTREEGEEEEKEKEKEEGEEEEKEEGEEEEKEEGEEEEKEGGKDLKKSDAEDEEEGEGHVGDVTSQKEESVKAEGEGDESVLMFDGTGYQCLICGWKTKQKSLGLIHVVRKHNIPKSYASQAIKQDIRAQEEEAAAAAAAGLSGDMLKEEMEATAKVVRFISNRFVCLICGWKNKLKGFAISHVVRSHDVERPYACKDCSLSFFLPSRLQQHVNAAHRPGRYACPFCCFRSHCLRGFRRHCSRCNAREEEEEEEVEGRGGGREEEENEEEDEEEKKGRRRARKRRRPERVIQEQEEEED